MDLIFLAYAGSHLYGLNNPDSDIDLRGVCLDPVSSLLGLQGFEQQIFTRANNWFSRDIIEPQLSIKSDDITIFGLKKFTKLMLDNNPNIIELLFAQNLLGSDVKGVASVEDIRVWNELFSNRELFLSDKIKHTFAGYAYSQLSRIKGHRRWIDNPPEKPDPFDYGMELTVKGGQRWIDSNKYNQYQSLMSDWQKYQTWLRERNPKRKELEVRYGYDTKHAMHLFRLIYEAQELLETGNLELPLKPHIRADLLDIRNGMISYDQMLSEAELEVELLKDHPSVLPHQPDRKKVDDLLIDIYSSRIRGEL